MKTLRECNCKWSSSNQEPGKGQHFRLACPASGGDFQISAVIFAWKDVLRHLLPVTDQSYCRHVYLCYHHTPMLPGRCTLWQDTSSSTPTLPCDSTDTGLQSPRLLPPNHSYWMTLEDHPSSLWSRQTAIEPMHGLNHPLEALHQLWTELQRWSCAHLCWALKVCWAPSVPQTKAGLCSFQHTSGSCAFVLASHAHSLTAKARRTDGAYQMRPGRLNDHQESIYSSIL